MKIALFDYSVTSSNAIGKCNLCLLAALCREHEFTVFSVEFENPFPERISWVRVPVLSWPSPLLYLTFHIVAPLCYFWHRLRHGVRFDLVQTCESILSFGDVSYPQFCNRAYLKNHWSESNPSGLRSWVRWMDHKLRATLEPLVYRRVRHIVVPSQGLRRELASEYPYARDKIRILPNPIDVEYMRQPKEFDRESFRRKLGVGPEELLLVFVALGHFERKGLPALLGALTRVTEPSLRLIVVGGRPGLISNYRSQVDRMGLTNRVSFLGMQTDVRPYLWAADSFTFPSLYEAFPLVSLESAAAGLPLIVSGMNGVEEFLRDGKNGILVDHTPVSVASGIERFLAMPREARQMMGEQAQHDVGRYDTKSFVAGWRHFYAERANHRDAGRVR